MPSNLEWFGAWVAASLSLWPSRRLRSLDCRGGRRHPGCGRVLQVGGLRESAPVTARSQLAPLPPCRVSGPLLPPRSAVTRSRAVRPRITGDAAEDHRVQALRLRRALRAWGISARRGVLFWTGMGRAARRERDRVGREFAVVRACVWRSAAGALVGGVVRDQRVPEGDGGW
jgi:hypothetical protein